MIDRLSLASLPPARRAAVIYGEARAELSDRLWQAALGSGSDDRSSDATPVPRRERGSLDALLASLTRNDDTDAPTLRPAVVPPNFAPVETASPSTAMSAIDPGGDVDTAIDGLGVNGRHAATLADAAHRTGIPASALAAIVDAESAKGADGSWQAFSRNPRSSAAGLGQFLSRTWEGMAETSGTWLNRTAQANGWLGANGQVRAESRASMLAARYDPVASINGIADYARRNLDGLRRAGVAADGDVRGTARLAYLGHHLGLGDAIKFLRDGGLSESRARTLLDAQVGGTASGRRIAAAAGDATSAHRTWLLGYLDRKVQPGKFAATV